MTSYQWLILRVRAPTTKPEVEETVARRRMCCRPTWPSTLCFRRIEELWEMSVASVTVRPLTPLTPRQLRPWNLPWSLPSALPEVPPPVHLPALPAWPSGAKSASSRFSGRGGKHGEKGNKRGKAELPGRLYLQGRDHPLTAVATGCLLLRWISASVVVFILVCASPCATDCACNCAGTGREAGALLCRRQKEGKEGKEKEGKEKEGKEKEGKGKEGKEREGRPKKPKGLREPYSGAFPAFPTFPAPTSRRRGTTERRRLPILQAAARPIRPPVQVSSAKESRRADAAHFRSELKGDDVEVVPDTVPGASEANFARIYAREEWGKGARSGLGSREETTREFRAFLEAFLRDHSVRSVVDAGCGHWPSGYQRFMDWQGVHYTGVDVVPYVVEENAAYFQDGSMLSSHGLSTARSLCGDVSEQLPPGDLLLVKDVLMHLPNRAVHSFLKESVNSDAPKYRLVMPVPEGEACGFLDNAAGKKLVQNEVPPVAIRDMVDIEPGQLLPFDISLPPFAARFEPVFRWKSDEPKVVQLWRAASG
ncbi:unnamed protein product [Symbiodinium natans]|uniref:Uncharacterized protein n=1 Tax=Symbiodinium natans TaxID=878477 RepID=A0A812R6D9_9DINO|nr:unnamed protein product [Symbiodinium natans]